MADSPTVTPPGTPPESSPSSPAAPSAPDPRPSGGQGGGRGGFGGGRGRGGFDRNRGRGGDQQQSQFIEKLISVNRVAKVHKGGKRLAFGALCVVGDGKGKVGVAMGKSNEAADAIRKGFTHAQRLMVPIAMKGTTIPHETIGEWDACRVLLQPAAPGTGILAGGPVRAVCEACGIRDILTKSLGSSNSINLAKATLAGLASIQTAEAILHQRSLEMQMEEFA